MISIPQLSRLAAPDSGADDEAVVAAFEAFEPSQNADFAFQHLLAATCAIARHRPHLLERLLLKTIDPGVSVGMGTLEQFWRYADYCVRRDSETPPGWAPDFTEESIAYLRGGLRSQEPLIERFLQECLEERRKENWGSSA